MNIAHFIGRLAKEPETATTATGKAVCNFTIAVPKKRKRDESDFVNCSAFGSTGEFCTKYMHKGNRVAVNGNVYASAWINKEGKAVAGLNLYVDDVELLTTKAENQQEAKTEPVKENPVEHGYIPVDPDDVLPF